MESKDHGLLFKPDMICAFLDGRKTQTRRVLTCMNTILDGDKRVSKEFWEGFDFEDVYLDNGPSPMGNPGPYLKAFNRISDARHRLYPIYMVGDRMWVREAWGLPSIEMKVLNPNVEVIYKTDIEYYLPFSHVIEWKSSLFMPKKYARIWRTITQVRIERVQEILPIDIVAEGVYVPGKYNWTKCESIAAFLAWEKKWNEINASRGYPWENNDWVIALTLEEL